MKRRDLAVMNVMKYISKSLRTRKMCSVLFIACRTHGGIKELRDRALEDCGINEGEYRNDDFSLYSPMDNSFSL